MAKFVTDDGKSGITGEAYMRQHCQNQNKPFILSTSLDISNRKYHTDISKLKIPGGRNNGYRLLNICTYDLLIHIQETLSLTNRCIIEMITNEDHKCINMNDCILNKIKSFAELYIDEKFKLEYPRTQVRYKLENTDDEYDYRMETDEEWQDRLCHIYMHKNHPNKLQMFKCEECLQRWMNSDVW